MCSAAEAPPPPAAATPELPPAAPMPAAGTHDRCLLLRVRAETNSGAAAGDDGAGGGDAADGTASAADGAAGVAGVAGVATTSPSATAPRVAADEIVMVRVSSTSTALVNSSASAPSRRERSPFSRSKSWHEHTKRMLLMLTCSTGTSEPTSSGTMRTLNLLAHTTVARNQEGMW